MKKIISVFIILSLFSSVFTQSILAAEDVVEFSLSAKRIGNQVKVDLNVKGAAGKEICVFGPIDIEFDDTKLEIPYKETGGFKNILSANYEIGCGTADSGYEAIVVTEDGKTVKILYVDIRGNTIKTDGTVLSLFFDVKNDGNFKFTLNHNNVYELVGDYNSNIFDFHCYDEIILMKNATNYTRITNKKPTPKTNTNEPYNPEINEPYNPETGIASKFIFIIIMATTVFVLCKTKKHFSH